jgi:type I restriction enzyme S subunit
MSTRDDSDQNIPPGWALATVGAIADYINGLAFKPSDWEENGRPIIRIQNLTGQSDHLNRTTRKVDAAYIVQPGTILVSWSATLDVFVWHGPEAVLNQHIFKVVPVAAMSDHSFVRWVLKNAIDEMWRGEHTHGTTMRHINRGPFLAHRLVLPPANEQARIAEVIDSYLSRLDAAVANLERAQVKLKAYRNSALEAAVNGRLVQSEASLARAEARAYEPADVLLGRILAKRRRRWEEAETAKLTAVGKSARADKSRMRYEEPRPPDLTALPSLPDGWCWASLDQVITEPLANGRSVPDGGGFPVLRLTSISGQVVELSERKTGLWDGVDPRPFTVKLNDFLIVRGNGSLRLVGRAGRVVTEPDPIAYPDTLIRARVASDALSPTLLSRFWDSSPVRRHIERRAKTTAGIYKVNQSDLRETPVPLPPMTEQLRIADELDRLDSVGAIMLRDVSRMLDRCHRLRQAVLKWAFEGKLVDQDPSDEPAENLLECIRTERGSKATVKRPRFRRATAKS